MKRCVFLAYVIVVLMCVAVEILGGRSKAM